MNKFLLLIFSFALIGCATTEDKNTVKLFVFDCGDITVSDVSVFSPGVDKGKLKKLTNSCYLIKHPQGNLIWDTGLPDGLAKMKNGKTNGPFHLQVKNTLESQLKELGLTPKDITHLGISHFHFDHTGNANLFTKAQLFIQKAEYKAAFGKNAKKYHFSPDSYSKLDRKMIKVLNGNHDVFGDGIVTIKPAPGHTPGHQVLYLNLPEFGPLVLSGDLYHFTKNRKHKRVPSFNFDKKQTLVSMDKIEKFVKKSKAKFWIQHDKEQNQNIKHSPEYYK